MSMGPWQVEGAEIMENARYVLAIELLSAMQALDLLSPLKLRPAGSGKAKLRAEIPMLKNVFLGEDMEKAAQLIAWHTAGRLNPAAAWFPAAGGRQAGDGNLSKGAFPLAVSGGSCAVHHIHFLAALFYPTAQGGADGFSQPG